jgi:CYTH domain-containing protein
MVELELEKTYLAKFLPADLKTARSEVISDVYVPETVDHATLRLRHRGDRYEITKKTPVDGNDSTRQNEHTIPLGQEEYEALAKCSEKVFIKRRYYCTIEGYEAEVDVYEAALAGLVVIDFEFSTDAQMLAFVPPAICLADVSQEAFAAGGKLAGKSYADIETNLKQYGYLPLKIEEKS